MCKYNKFHIISTNFGVIFHIISIILGLIFHICGFFVIKKGRCLQRPYRDYVLPEMTMQNQKPRIEIVIVFNNC